MAHFHGHPHHHGHSHPHLDLESAGQLMRRASLFSLIVAGTLIAMKSVAWSMTDSLSMMSSLADSVLDILASLVNFFAVRYALQPPDSEHRFGHGKAEDIASLAQGTFIAGSGMFICIEGIRRIFRPEPIEHSGIGIAVMAVSILLTLALVLYQRYVSRMTSSGIIAADSLHYMTDLLTNLAVIGALILSAQFGLTWADPLFALAIAGYIMYGAWEIAQHAFQNLMDHEFADPQRQRIKEIVLGHAGVRGMHDLKTRRSGIYGFIQLDVELDATITLQEAHDIAETIMQALKAVFPHVEVLIHQDPAGQHEKHEELEDNKPH